jgi:lysophospholipase L1-like esterase
MDFRAYLALGDSISIDDYTGVPGGGAAKQFARLIGAESFQDLTEDGCTTSRVICAIARVQTKPDIVTLTAGGNDLLASCLLRGEAESTGTCQNITDEIALSLEAIARLLEQYSCPVIVSTIYDPSDGDDAILGAMGIPADFRATYNAVNESIRQMASEHGFLVSDLEQLFRGHGSDSSDPWITLQIEPNYAGATAIARYWHELLARHVGIK